MTKRTFLSHSLSEKGNYIFQVNGNSSIETFPFQTINQNVLRMVTDLDDNHLDTTLREILRPRVVNTTGHEYVKSYIIR